MQLTRLAPSPTGALHLGNARTFLINWLLARQNGWRIILRIEDLDGPRVKRGADAQAIEDLQWLGLDWDQGPIYQAARAPVYAKTIQSLIDKRLAYPCICTRREASLAASAPHSEDGAAVYPGTCCGRFATVEEARQAAGREPAIRFRLPAAPFEFVDQFQGQQRWSDLQKQLGDFVIAKADGTAAYHLAVVVDDAEQGVTQIVRGDDLLDSVPRQAMLYEALDLKERMPVYTHLPLVIGPDGMRLAKRHGDTRLSYFREAGTSPGRLRALLARWCGIDAGDQIKIPELLKHFSLAKVAREQVICTDVDSKWLIGR